MYICTMVTVKLSVTQNYRLTTTPSAKFYTSICIVNSTV